MKYKFKWIQIFNSGIAEFSGDFDYNNEIGSQNTYSTTTSFVPCGAFIYQTLVASAHDASFRARFPFDTSSISRVLVSGVDLIKPT